MCPKCKSRERYKLINGTHLFIPAGAMDKSFIEEWQRTFSGPIILYDGRPPAIVRCDHDYFYCSGCGYELGRYG